MANVQWTTALPWTFCRELKGRGHNCTPSQKTELYRTGKKLGYSECHTQLVFVKNCHHMQSAHACNSTGSNACSKSVYHHGTIRSMKLDWERNSNKWKPSVPITSGLNNLNNFGFEWRLSFTFLKLFLFLCHLAPDGVYIKSCCFDSSCTGISHAFYWWYH